MTDDLTEAAELLALLTSEDTSWSRVTKEVVEAGDVHSVLEARGSFQGDLFGDDLGLMPAIEAWRVQLLSLASEDVVCTPITSPLFPGRLRTLTSPPPFVFTRGRRDVRDHQGVAVIGSRQVPSKSLEIARSWSEALADRGTVIVSGLAAGVDRQAHLGALEVNARTVAVIGTGIQKVYPRENADLQARIASQGLLVSQFLPDQAPSKTTFPMRNAVMAAWAGTTLVIDARERSGASLQARLTVEQGRALLIHEQLKNEPWVRKFTDDGQATVVSSPEEVWSLL